MKIDYDIANVLMRVPGMPLQIKMGEHWKNLTDLHVGEVFDDEELRLEPGADLSQRCALHCLAEGLDIVVFPSEVSAGTHTATAPLAKAYEVPKE